MKIELGFFSLLTALFVALKLGGYIDWSWWWVLAPTWMSMAAGLLLIAVAVACAMADNGPRR